MRQIAAPMARPAQLSRGLQKSLNVLAAHELGIDPEHALAVNWRAFSVHAPFMALAMDARAIATYLTVTGFDVPVTELASYMDMPKQIVSRHVRRGEDIRSRPHYGRIITRMEQMLGVTS